MSVGTLLHRLLVQRCKQFIGKLKPALVGFAAVNLHAYRNGLCI